MKIFDSEGLGNVGKGDYIKMLDQLPSGAKLPRASGIWMYSVLLKLQSSGTETPSMFKKKSWIKKVKYFTMHFVGG